MVDADMELAEKRLAHRMQQENKAVIVRGRVEGRPDGKKIKFLDGRGEKTFQNSVDMLNWVNSRHGLVYDASQNGEPTDTIVMGVELEDPDKKES